MKSIFNYKISIILSVIILILCFIKLGPLPEKIPMTNLDKLAHFLMFLSLSCVVFFENTAYFKRAVSYERIVLGSFLFPLLFSGGVEIMQEYLTTYRSGDWMDFLYDGIGAFFGLAICLKINSKLDSGNF